MPLFPLQRPAPQVLLVLSLACAVWAAGFFASVWSQSGGHFMLPLDDAYIHLQYARRLAQGHFLSYSPGSAPSGGATSPLWVGALAPGFLIGFHGVKGALIAFLLGVPLAVLTGWWLYLLGQRLGGEAGGWLAALLFASNGHIFWAYFSGMETGLFAALLVGALVGLGEWFAEERSEGRTLALVCLALLPLARPEGIGLLGLLFLLSFFRRRGSSMLNPLALLACAVPFVLWMLALRAATGTWKPSGLVMKGLFADPETSLWGALRTVATTWFAVAVDFFQNRIPDPGYAQLKARLSLPYVPAGLFLVALFGGALATVADWRARRPSLAGIAFCFWLAGLASVAGSRWPFIHQQRYLVPWTVLALPLAALGGRRIGALFQQHEEAVLRALTVAGVALSLPGMLWWMTEYGKNGRDLYHQHRTLSFTVEGLPPTTVLGVSDTGILVYFSNRPHVDLIGLTSQEFTHAAPQGEGAILEALQSLPPDRRPTMLSTYRGLWSTGFPFGELTAAAAIRDNTITSGAVLPLNRVPAEIYHDPAANERTLWSLDVLDPSSEQAAGYQFNLPPSERRPEAWPTPNRPARTYGELSDGARWVWGERFDVTLTGDSTEATTATLRLRVAPGAEDIEPGRVSSRLLLVEGLAQDPGTPQEVVLEGAPDAWAEGRLVFDLSVLPRTVSVRSADPGRPGWYSAHIWVEASGP